MQIMFRTLDAKKYWFASNEAGVHLNHRNNLSHDVAVHDRTALTVDKINKKYANVPARVAVEIDVKADLPNEADRNYVNRKPQNYLISAPTKQSGFFLIRSRLWWPNAPPVPG